MITEQLIYMKYECFTFVDLRHNISFCIAQQQIYFFMAFKWHMPISINHSQRLNLYRVTQG